MTESEILDTIDHLNDTWEAEIVKIKEEFSIDPHFNLTKYLIFLVRIFNRLELLKEKIRINSETKKPIEDAIKYAIKHINSLNALPDFLKTYSDYLISPAKSIMQSDEFNSLNWDLSSYLVNSKFTLVILLYMKEVLSKKRKTREEDHIRTILINLIVDMFRKHSSQPLDLPIKNGRKNIYVGVIVDFVLRIELLLGRLGVSLKSEGTLGADSTIGKTICKIMNEYDELKIAFDLRGSN